MKMIGKRVFLLFSIAMLVACSNDVSISNYDMPTSRVCADRVIDKDNPPSEVAVLGNSLLMGNGGYGLSASDPTKDFFARLDSAFLKLNPDYVGKRIMAKQTERALNNDTLLKSISDNITPSLSSATDLVIIQLGDNISSDDEISRIKITVGSIMDSVCAAAPNAKVAWVGEWYSTGKKQRILKDMSNAFGIQFIDISDLNVKENQGHVGDVTTYPDSRVQTIKYKSYQVSGDTIRISFKEDGNVYESSVLFEEYYDDAKDNRINIVGHQGIVTDAFAATHPNDEGFRKIAERILEDLGF